MTFYSKTIKSEWFTIFCSLCMHAFRPDGGMGNSAAVVYSTTGVITTKPAGRRNRPPFAEIWTISSSKAEIVLTIDVAPAWCPPLCKPAHPCAAQTLVFAYSLYILQESSGQYKRPSHSTKPETSPRRLYITVSSVFSTHGDGRAGFGNIDAQHVYSVVSGESILKFN